MCAIDLYGNNRPEELTEDDIDILELSILPTNLFAKIVPLALIFEAVIELLNV